MNTPTHREHRLSDRCLVIRSNLPTDPPDWRVAYFGFNEWHKASGFIFSTQTMLEKRHGPGDYCKSRKSKRLKTKFEVKVRRLSKPDVMRLHADIERVHFFNFEPVSGAKLLRVVINGTAVGTITADSRQWMLEQLQSVAGHNHRDMVRLASGLILGPQQQVS
jgi:hypothetical protein